MDVYRTKILIFVFIILLFLPLVNAGLNINTEKGDVDFDKNVTIKSTGTGFVPYIGATGNVDLGVYDLTADWILAKINWSYIQNIPAGFQSKAGGGPYLYNTTSTIYLNGTVANNTWVPYTGATKDVVLGRYNFSANATSFTGNMSISVDGDAEIVLDSATNEDSCLILQETDNLGFNFCYDGSGTNRWVVRNNNGTIWFEIERDTGETRIYNNTIINGNLTVDDYITSSNVFIPQYLFSHNNATIPVFGASTWTNVTFDQEDSDIKQGISHTYNDNTNHTFTIMDSGIYDISYDVDVEDTSASASNIDVAIRLVNSSGDEVIGSVFEADITKQGTEVELSHRFLINSLANQVYYLQFVAQDADVQISTHGTFGDHPESASIVINKVANL